MAKINSSVLPSLAPELERDTPEECPECGSPDIVEDWKEGQNVCRSCGLVIQEKLVDLGCEWRTFTNDEPGADPNRASGPANPLLESGANTSISMEGGRGIGSSLNRAQNMHTISASDRYLLDVFAEISKLCERNSIPHKVQERCNEMFKLYYDVLTLRADGTRVRSLREEETKQIIAGVLLLSLRGENMTRTFTEISRMTGVPKRDLGRVVKLIDKRVKSTIATSATTYTSMEDVVLRCCSALGLERKVVNAATELANKARDLDRVYGRTPVSIAAACIFIICQLGPQDERKTAKQVSDAALVAEVTIRAAYNKIYPHLKGILPEGYENSERFKDLPVPQTES
uniref:General transcription factor TFIIB n=3 Tax=Rhodosorus marinus TaxID=101924 RepID=A0A7S3EGB1_9RHOD|mmetsp:Transcript_33745/g.132667  ORF Transcript_33745/g.132667 Transcript_33745/m.132667 type:complete len:344 (+) Transcript_33745:229-1260(+)